MFPPKVDTDFEPNSDQLVEQLVVGYDALATEIKLLDEQRRELENKVSWSKQQYLDALKRYSPDNASQEFRTFLDELDEAGACKQEGEVHWLESMKRCSDVERKRRSFNIQRAQDAREKIRLRQFSSEASHGVRIWSGRSADPRSEMEQDFTTPGTPGRLRCPFVPPASINTHRDMVTPRSSTSRVSLSGRRSKRSSFHDPVRAEICGQKPPSTAPSLEGSIPLCPIRFLDQHTPEEVAQYFEKHKHELPRSHEICVKRYQTNEASIRQLDAKYGNIISMIQGLGAKHQPWFPEVNDDDIAVEEEPDQPTSQRRVHNWAKAVSVSLMNPEDEQIERATEGEDRQSCFDRPLKDVRVGESPSRPWGIAVPARYTEALGASSKSDHTASPLEASQDENPGQSVKGKCPFDFGNTEAPPGHLKKTEPTLPADKTCDSIHIPSIDGISKPKTLLGQHPYPTPEQSAPLGIDNPVAEHQLRASLNGPFHGPVFISSKQDPRAVLTGPFHGPVIIGYEMHEALTFLRHQQNGSTK